VRRSFEGPVKPGVVVSKNIQASDKTEKAHDHSLHLGYVVFNTDRGALVYSGTILDGTRKSK
jgi:hypothetical protein